MRALKASSLYLIELSGIIICDESCSTRCALVGASFVKRNVASSRNEYSGGQISGMRKTWKNMRVKRRVPPPRFWVGSRYTTAKSPRMFSGSYRGCERLILTGDLHGML